MTALQDLSAADFSPLVGQPLVVHLETGGTQVLELTEARILGGRHAGSNREPFALTFRGPTGLRLPQAIQRFEIQGIGALEIFITQTADDARGSWFEAIFT